MIIIDMEEPTDINNIVVQSSNEDLESDSDLISSIQALASIDEQSIRGQFGWCMLHEQFLPFIYRNDEKYCSAEIFENIFLGTLVSRINPIVYYGCTKINSYKTTSAEVKLLNEINIVHCDSLFNKDVKGIQYEFLILLEDATQFLDFLKIAFEVLYRPRYISNKCGFLIIGSSCVSFIVINGEKYIPMLYFEGTEHCKIDTVIVKGWDVPYLKFCLTIQKLRNEFIAENELECGSLESLKAHLPPRTDIAVVCINNISHCKFGPVYSNKKYMNWFHQPAIEY